MERDVHSVAQVVNTVILRSSSRAIANWREFAFSVSGLEGGRGGVVGVGYTPAVPVTLALGLGAQGPILPTVLSLSTQNLPQHAVPYLVIYLIKLQHTT